MILKPGQGLQGIGPDKQEKILENEKSELRRDLESVHKEKQIKLLEEIKKDQPFGNQEPFIDYMTIKHITPISFEESGTGEVFRIETDNGKKYKLRKCYGGKERADGISNNIKDCKEVLPKFYGQQNEYLLFDWIDGLINFGEYNKDDKWEKLGILMANIHKVQNINIDKEKIQQRCRKRIDKKIIQNEFSDTERKKIEEKINEGLNNPKIVLGLDLRDATTDNIKVDEQGRFYLIDEESIDITIQGIGIGKLLRHRPEKVNMAEIQKGYEMIIKNDNIFKKDFLLFARLFMQLSNLRRRKLDHENIESIQGMKKIIVKTIGL